MSAQANRYVARYGRASPVEIRLTPVLCLAFSVPVVLRFIPFAYVFSSSSMSAPWAETLRKKENDSYEKRARRPLFYSSLSNLAVAGEAHFHVAAVVAAILGSVLQRLGGGVALAFTHQRVMAGRDVGGELRGVGDVLQCLVRCGAMPADDGIDTVASRQCVVLRGLFDIERFALLIKVTLFDSTVGLSGGGQSNGDCDGCENAGFHGVASNDHLLWRGALGLNL